jgi:hypothetical protein
MHTDPTFNQTYQPWWDSQPSPNEVLCAELLSEEQLAMLQSPWLVSSGGRCRGSRGVLPVLPVAHHA